MDTPSKSAAGSSAALQLSDTYLSRETIDLVILHLGTIEISSIK